MSWNGVILKKTVLESHFSNMANRAAKLRDGKVSGKNSKRAHRNLQNHKFSKLPKNFPGKPLFKHEMTVL